MKRYLLEELYQEAVCENPNEPITFGWLINCIEKIKKIENTKEGENYDITINK